MLLLEFIVEFFAEALAPQGDLSKRGEVVVRLLFGLLLAALGVAGMWFTHGYDASAHFRWAGIALFFFLACFGLFNVAFGRTWRWPGRLFVVSLVMLFVVRILFGP